MHSECRSDCRATVAPPKCLLRGVLIAFMLLFARGVHLRFRGYELARTAFCVHWLTVETRKYCATGYGYMLSKNDDYCFCITEFEMNEAPFDWLIMAKSIKGLKALSESLNAINVRFDQNIVVAFPDHGWRKKGNLDIYVIQVFKMRLNSTLLVAFLGEWNQKQSMRSVNAPYPVEARNLMGEIFIVGRCNSSKDGSTVSDEEASSTPELLDNVLDFLTQRLNATSLSRYYVKLGYRSYEGAWTGLLGALMEHSVDIALEPVTAVTSRQSDMDFIFPITRTMCNIYIRHQETSAVRDIFLAPFSPQLIACAVCVALVASITMMIISKTCLTARYMSFTDAIIWSMGILCQQGSSWRPSNAAASVVLIVSLLFALVIYNAYAAFITSVLSVRVATVASLADVLQSSNIKIGYVRNGADQMYLMSTKDVQLNAFYIRGYSEAENLVSSTEEGLVRAAIQDYAFFSGQRAARTTIRSLSQARGRCALRELPVLSTRAQVAFPLPSGSPYARPVLISLLQLRSGGILARLEAALVPSMPQCEPSSGFASARAADVKTALFVILTGYVIAILIGIAEYLWENRKDIKRHLRRRWRQIFNSKDHIVNKNSSLQ
ncbi:probable glutamate receptor [Vanessa atalanta]|uniref:probable glutamate receptor n=1 Tax=Vanessa atalanta TaxID=42275 RepID=UPI001FCD5270|nr:probable glutamate receptor [Vanessa atalanta]